VAECPLERESRFREVAYWDGRKQGLQKRGHSEQKEVFCRCPLSQAQSKSDRPLTDCRIIRRHERVGRRLIIKMIIDELHCLGGLCVVSVHATFLGEPVCS
jgi:GAF domain-containing protein